MSLAGWQFNEKITINHNLIDENLTDFPHLVKLTSSNFDFSKAQTNGEDMRFTDAAGNLLSYERERHDSTNEKAEYWVKIPSISSTVDTTIWMYFGNTNATDGEDPTNVWDSNHQAVYHMNQDPSGTAPQILDSTSNNNDGTSHGSMTSTDLVEGQVGKALNFDGVDDYIQLPYIDTFNTSDFTISFFVNYVSANAGRYLFSTGDAKSADNYVLIYFYGTNTNPNIDFYSDDLGANDDCLANSWNQITVTFERGTQLRKIYVNGNLSASDTSGGVPSVANGADTGNGIWLGQYSSRFAEFLEDEVRVSNIVRSAAWLKASYNSQNDSLASYGNIQTNGNAIMFGMGF